MTAAEAYEQTRLALVQAKIDYEAAVGAHLESKRILQAEMRGHVIPLTFREAEVVDYVRQGLPNKIIADKLNVTERTISFHVTNLLKKHGTHSRSLL